MAGLRGDVGAIRWFLFMGLLGLATANVAGEEPDPACIVDPNLPHTESGNYVDCTGPEQTQEGTTDCCDVDGTIGCCDKDASAREMRIVSIGIGSATAALILLVWLRWYCNAETLPCLAKCCPCCRGRKTCCCKKTGDEEEQLQHEEPKKKKHPQDTKEPQAHPYEY